MAILDFAGGVALQAVSECIFYQILMPSKRSQSNNLVFRILNKVYFHKVSFSKKNHLNQKLVVSVSVSFITLLEL